ncbi:MAG: type VI secretion system Vgr family protein [Sandaracinaceae bacterium]
MNDAQYELELDNPQERYPVHMFYGREALNRPYRYEASFETRDAPVNLDGLLGTSACVTLLREGHARRFPGIIERVEVGNDQERTVTLALVPALSLLSLKQDTRVFQDQTVPEILRAVLEPALQETERTLSLDGLDASQYTTRDYCVQYRETTLDFVHRLMEEEGIGYYFDVGDALEVLTLFDNVANLVAVPTLDNRPVPYFPDEGRVEREHVRRFDRADRLVSRGVAVRDWDWTRGRPILDASAGEAEDLYEHGFGDGVTTHEKSTRLRALSYAAEVAQLLPGVTRELGAAGLDLRGVPLPSFTEDDADRKADLRSQAATRDAKQWSGVGQLIGMYAGATLELEGHPEATDAYYVSEVEHGSPNRVGVSSQEPYVNRFICLPRSTPWRPDRTTRKPRIYGVQTATVTGPEGLDVHTDPHGRIRVRFPWDRRDGDLRGATSCWLRVSQPWAGSGGPGFVFLPRIGMEVIVTFIDGDPDRPLATGTVYNGASPTPTMLPLQATKSVIRTRSIPHGLGYNELSFEDAAGHERVHLRAQRDLEEVVLDSHTTHVGGDQTNRVDGNHQETIGGHARLSVGRDHRVAVHGDRFEQIMGSVHQVVEGTVNQRVEFGVTSTSERGGHLLQSLEGDTILHAKRQVLLNQDQQNFVGLGETGVEVASEQRVSLEAGDATVGVGDGAVALGAGGAAVGIAGGGIELSLGAATLSLSDGAIEMTVGGTTLRVSAGSITANGKELT